ncbi:MAG: glutamine-hydrolyzing carbamoyl-phosphate synthase small subunit [Balneolales bacterium]
MNSFPRKKAILALADGTVVHGISVGYEGLTGGELCFNTSMTGYQEIATDPSYHGQLMMMTYPHIGNYGTSSRDDEAAHVMISGMIMRAYSDDFDNPMADGSLHEYLKSNKIVGIFGVDTRKLVRHIRSKGVVNAVISSTELDEQKLINKAKEWPSMSGLELASKVTREDAQTIPSSNGKSKYKVAALDYGMKQNIINNLAHLGCTLRIFPAKTPFDEIMKWNPDGFFFSNGPGDPNPMTYALETVNQAKATGLPIFGICLGHQIMALSEGLQVDKMFVGHRGANQPVKNLRTGEVEITTQNHGFAINQDSITDEIAEITHINLNDNTVEGINFKRFNGFSLQYHPEASPGPHDSAYLFDEFLNRLEQGKKEYAQV